jgi:hypothetical protein
MEENSHFNTHAGRVSIKKSSCFFFESLKYYKIFKGDGKPTLCLILDGHKLCLDLLFLFYICKIKYPLSVVVGVLHATFY